MESDSTLVSVGVFHCSFFSSLVVDLRQCRRSILSRAKALFALLPALVIAQRPESATCAAVLFLLRKQIARQALGRCNEDEMTT